MARIGRSRPIQTLVRRTRSGVIPDRYYAVPYEGANGVALTNGSGGGDTVTGVLTSIGTLTFSTAQKMHGTSSARAYTPSGSGSPSYTQHYIDFNGETSNRTLTSMYLRIASVPDIRTGLLSYTDAGGTRRFGLSLNADRTLTVGYGPSTDKATSSTPLSLDTWYRLEFFAQSVPAEPVATTLLCHIYAGDSTTVVETVGGSYTDIFTLYNWQRAYVFATITGTSATALDLYRDSLQIFWDGTSLSPKVWVEPVGGKPSVWMGAAHVPKPGKVYMGSGPGFVEKPWKRWTGANWTKLGLKAFSDNFNRANAGDLGANWGTNYDLYSISGNRVAPEGATAYATAWATPCATNDNFSQITVTQLSTLSTGVFCRWSSSTDGENGTGYVWRVSNGTSGALFRFTGGGAYTEIGTGYAFTLAAGDVLKISAVGSTITGYVNGVARLVVTDSVITTGKYVGLRTASTGTQDDWYGGDV